MIARSLDELLRKLLDYDSDVLLLCDGQPVLGSGKLKVAEFSHLDQGPVAG